MLAAGHYAHDTFIKAIGTLAQVIYIITLDEQRTSPKRRHAVVKNVFKTTGYGNWSDLAYLAPALMMHMVACSEAIRRLVELGLKAK